MVTTSRGRILIWILPFIAAVGIYYFALATYFEMTPVNPTQFGGSTYGSMWNHLIHGQFDIDPEHNPEKMFRDGKCYTYYGIFPAFLRGIMTVFYSWEKPIGNLMCVFAALLTLICLFLTGIEMGLHQGDSRRWFILILGVFSLASPLVFIMGPGHVYHEAILWSVFLNVLSNLFFFKFVLGKETSRARNLCLMALVAGIEFNTRVPMAVSPAILFAVTCGFSLISEKELIPRKSIGVASSVLGILVLVMLFVNFERFGNPFSFSPPELHKEYLKEGRLDKIRKNGFLAWDRLPVNFEYYFVPHADSFTGHWPYIVASQTLVSMPFANDYDWIEPVSEYSSPLFTPVLMGVAAMGAFLLFRRKKSGLENQKAKFFRALFTTSLANWLFMLSFCALCFRYQADFFPLLSALSLIAIYLYRGKKSNAVFVLFTLLFAYSATATFVLSLNHKQHWPLGVIEERVNWVNEKFHLPD